VQWRAGEDPFFISLCGDLTEEITTFWERLSAGAAVIAPLAPAQWAILYGILKDRFGTLGSWTL